MPASRQSHHLRQNVATYFAAGGAPGPQSARPRMAPAQPWRDRGIGLDAGVRARPRGAICKKITARNMAPRTIGRDADAPASTAAILPNGDASMEPVSPRNEGEEVFGKSGSGAHGSTALVQPKREELRELFGLGQGEVCSPLGVAAGCGVLLLHVPLVVP